MLVNTGDGKGKSTAAFGVVMRAVARGWRVCVIQFIKSGKWKVGEEAIGRQLGVDWLKGGDGFTWDSPDLDESRGRAVAAWALAAAGDRGGDYELVVLDEITYPLNWGWIDADEVIAAIRERPEHVNVVATGRDAPAALIELADTVTEMVKVKHAYDRGIERPAGDRLLMPRSRLGLGARARCDSAGIRLGSTRSPGSAGGGQRSSAGSGGRAGARGVAPLRAARRRHGRRSAGLRERERGCGRALVRLERARRTLAAAARRSRLATPSRRDELAEARRRAPALVGRDPRGSTRPSSPARRSSRSPRTRPTRSSRSLLWFALGGAPGAAAHRAVNTLDAMVGHRSERYREFGWAAARLDDAANWLPARLTRGAFAVALLAPLVGGSRFGDRSRRAAATAAPSEPERRPASRRPSRRAGAAARRRNRYGGRLEQRPSLGRRPSAAVGDIARAVRLSRAGRLPRRVVLAGFAWSSRR